MNEIQKAAFVFSQSICAYGEIEAMVAANKEREHRGESMAYSEQDFMAVIDKYCISHNAVVNLFRA